MILTVRAHGLCTLEGFLFGDLIDLIIDLRIWFQGRCEWLQMCLV